eukprot:6623043-Prymnesium_polylepis.3
MSLCPLPDGRSSACGTHHAVSSAASSRGLCTTPAAGRWVQSPDSRTCRAAYAYTHAELCIGIPSAYSRMLCPTDRPAEAKVVPPPLVVGKEPTTWRPHSPHGCALLYAWHAPHTRVAGHTVA